MEANTQGIVGLERYRTAIFLFAIANFDDDIILAENLLQVALREVEVAIDFKFMEFEVEMAVVGTKTIDKVIANDVCYFEKTAFPRGAVTRLGSRHFALPLRSAGAFKVLKSLR